MIDLPRHLEEHLGEMDGGWSVRKGLSIARFVDAPWPGAFTLVTTGVSHHALEQRSGRTLRQEFLMCTTNADAVRELSRVLSGFSEFVLEHHSAVPYGQVIGPTDPVLPGSEMNHLYATVPGIYPPAMNARQDVDPPLILVMLLPLFPGEAEVARRVGRDRFEDELERLDADLWDLHRSELELAL